MLTQERLSKIAYKVIGCAIEVHKHLGPGLLESVYHQCLEMEIAGSGLHVQSLMHVPLKYKEQVLRSRLQLDLLVEDCLIVELKAVETVTPLHQAQLLSYLRLTGKPKGLLINFNCENITEQVVSRVTDQYRRLPAR